MVIRRGGLLQAGVSDEAPQRPARAKHSPESVWPRAFATLVVRGTGGCGCGNASPLPTV
jgi:hypothetical protein